MIVRILASELARAIGSVIRATGVDYWHPSLNNVLLKSAGLDTFECVATTGAWIARYQGGVIECQGAEGDAQTLIPKEFAREILRALRRIDDENENHVAIFDFANRTVSLPWITMSWPLGEGGFPPYAQAIPNYDVSNAPDRGVPMIGINAELLRDVSASALASQVGLGELVRCDMEVRFGNGPREPMRFDLGPWTAVLMPVRTGDDEWNAFDDARKKRSDGGAK